MFKIAPTYFRSQGIHHRGALSSANQALYKALYKAPC